MMPVATLATFRWRLSLLSSIDFPYLLSTLAGEENRVGGGERELIRWPGLLHGRKPSCQGSFLHQIKEPLAPVLFWITNLSSLHKTLKSLKKLLFSAKNYLHDKVGRQGLGWVGVLKNVSKYTMPFVTSPSK